MPKSCKKKKTIFVICVKENKIKKDKFEWEREQFRRNLGVLDRIGFLKSNLVLEKTYIADNLRFNIQPTDFYDMLEKRFPVSISWRIFWHLKNIFKNCMALDSSLCKK